MTQGCAKHTEMPVADTCAGVLAQGHTQPVDSAGILGGITEKMFFLRASSVQHNQVGRRPYREVQRRRQGGQHPGLPEGQRGGVLQDVQRHEVFQACRGVPVTLRASGCASAEQESRRVERVERGSMLIGRLLTSVPRRARVQAWTRKPRRPLNVSNRRTGASSPEMRPACSNSSTSWMTR